MLQLDLWKWPLLAFDAVSRYDGCNRLVDAIRLPVEYGEGSPMKPATAGPPSPFLRSDEHGTGERDSQFMADLDSSDSSEGEESSVMKKFRADLKAKDDQIAELVKSGALRDRADLFREAGVTQEGAGKYFRKAYDGEETVEAIKAEAEAAGILDMTPLEGGKPSPEPVADQQEREAHERINNASTPGVGDPTSLDSKIGLVETPEELNKLLTAEGFTVIADG